MRRAADVRSLDALKDAKAALAEFREIAGVALSEAQAEVQRTIWWIQHDRKSHWDREIRRRTEKLANAKSELYRAQLSATAEERPSCIDEKKAVERAERALDEARQKLEHVRKWGRLLDREFMLFKGRMQPIARALESDLPRGEAKLELHLARLEKYVQTQAPVTDGARRPGDEDEAGAAAPPGGAGGTGDVGDVGGAS